MSPAMLLVVRHGAAVGNGEHRFIGWSDAPLDGNGRIQAERIAERLAGVSIDRIVSSDLRRAVETAAPLSERLGIEIETDSRLREIHNGRWTGLLPQEIEDGWPELWTDYVTGTDVERPDGETWSDVRARVVAALAELVTEDHMVAVFTHAGPVVLAGEWALGIHLPGNVFRGTLASPGNASITTIVPGPRLLGYADVGHLTAVPGVEIPYARVD